MTNKIYLLILFCSFSTVLTAQDHREVPQSVKVQFMEDFISASSTKWAADRGGNYTASFVHQGEVKTASYGEDGTWLFTETRLFPGQVPPAVQESLSDNYRIDNIEQIRKIQNKLGISFTFRVKIKDRSYDIEIDSSGKIKSKKKVAVFENEPDEKEREKQKEDDEKEREKQKNDDEKHREKMKKKKKKDKNDKD